MSPSADSGLPRIDEKPREGIEESSWDITRGVRTLVVQEPHAEELRGIGEAGPASEVFMLRHVPDPNPQRSRATGRSSFAARCRGTGALAHPVLELEDAIGGERAFETIGEELGRGRLASFRGSPARLLQRAVHHVRLDRLDPRNSPAVDIQTLRFERELSAARDHIVDAVDSIAQVLENASLVVVIGGTDFARDEQRSTGAWKSAGVEELNVLRTRTVAFAAEAGAVFGMGCKSPALGPTLSRQHIVAALATDLDKERAGGVGQEVSCRPPFVNGANTDASWDRGDAACIVENLQRLTDLAIRWARIDRKVVARICRGPRARRAAALRVVAARCGRR